MKKLEGICKVSSSGHDGFAVFYKKGKDRCWNHIRNLKRLVRFIKNLDKRKIKFDVYSCNVKEKFKKEKIKALLQMGNNKEEKLMLDD